MSIFAEVNGELKKVGESFNFKPKSIAYADSPYSLEDDYNMIFANSASGNIQIDLPNPADNLNRNVFFAKTSASNSVTVKYSTTTIRTLTSDNEMVSIVCDGTSWTDYNTVISIAEDIPVADSNSRFTATDVENALQELAGSGRSTETVKDNADDIATLSNTVTSLANSSVQKTGSQTMAGSLTVQGNLAADVGLTVGGGSSVKKITVSSSAPSGGSDGDIWIRYES
jgi:predicted ATP-dependent Lon-type protease